MARGRFNTAIADRGARGRFCERGKRRRVQGIRVGSPKIVPTDAEETSRVTITDCHLHDGDYVYLGAPAIWVGQSSGNTVAHNEINGAFQWAVSVGWNWGYLPPNR